MLPLGKEHGSPEIEEVMFEPCPGVNKKLSLMAQMIKNLPAMQETRVQSLDWEDPLEKGMAAHSNILAWRIPRTEEPGGFCPWGHKESDTTECLTPSLSLISGIRGGKRSSRCFQNVRVGFPADLWAGTVGPALGSSPSCESGIPWELSPDGPQPGHDLQLIYTFLM